MGRQGFAGRINVMMETELTERGKRAWGALLLTHGIACKRIDRELTAAGALSMERYDILLHLEDAPQQRLKMCQLAEAALFSRSGLTRVVDQMVQEGYIARDHDPSDRRVVYAVLTEKGLAERKRSWESYSRLIWQHFARYLNDAEADQVAQILQQVRARLTDAES